MDIILISTPEPESNRLLLVRVRFGSSSFSKVWIGFGSVRTRFLGASSGSVRFVFFF